MQNNLKDDRSLILIFNSEINKWEEKKDNIFSITKSYYYGNFSGYNVRFKENYKTFFYKKDSIFFSRYIKEISIKDNDVFVDGYFVDAIKVELFEYKYYKITTSNRVVVSKNVVFKGIGFKQTQNYFYDLAAYANVITKEGEPLNLLANNYRRIIPSLDSVVIKYYEGFNNFNKDNSTIIVPFDYNLSQYTAIEKALSNDISVIEGPPGTGKTQTILNLIANIVYRNKNCAVVSNNNTAINNVFEKLLEEEIDFISATLGRADNVKEFFDLDNENELKMFLRKDIKIHKIDHIQKINALSNIIKTINNKELEKAKLRSELNDISSEYKNFQKAEIPNLKINKRLSSNDYLKLIERIQEPKKIRFIDKFNVLLTYRFKLSLNNMNKALMKLSALFYSKRISEIKNAINKVDIFLNKHNKGDLTKEIKIISKELLLKTIKEHYDKIEVINFEKESYKKDYTNFLKRYPVVLSTSQSLLNNAPRNFLFDYLIIDEASQGDLLSSVLAMSCAKRVVVIGDSKQLQQINEERLFVKSKELSTKHQIKGAYQYESNSILSSILEAIKEVPVTLLREHYRCAPDIISFCNKMFYNNQLIPMTENTGTHLEVIKTVPGNHARKNPNGPGLYNQREIDEIEKLILHKNVSKIGIITPFRYQAELINEKVKDKELEADTIHKFQGRQKDEIILSFVANSLEKTVDNIENKMYDFLTNKKLLNVAISRGKNKVTAIVSDNIYNSKNNIISDFIKYIEYLYGSESVKESIVVSIFDYLYLEQSKRLIKKFEENPKKYESEILMSQLIDEVLINYEKIGYTMHNRLSSIINDTSFLSNEEKKYVLHPWTHVDYLFYNKVTKELLFVMEVDGIKYHEQSQEQTKKDRIKDLALKNNNINVYRFKTNESGEKDRITKILDKFY